MRRKRYTVEFKWFKIIAKFFASDVMSRGQQLLEGNIFHMFIQKIECFDEALSREGFRRQRMGNFKSAEIQMLKGLKKNVLLF